MASDPSTGTVVLAGGWDGSSEIREKNDTWAWGGTSWALRGGVTPFKRTWASMAYDGARGKVLLFGGSVGSGHCNETNDTWTWDGVTGEWAQESTPILGEVPPVRAGASMAYDAATDKVVLFGGWAECRGLAGTDPGGYRGDTWLWDGVTRTWSKQTPATSPPARVGASMAYDEVRRKVLLFGGGTDNDTWSWDGVAKTWTEETPAESPPPRAGAAMAYHAASGKVVLVGGYDFDEDTVTDATWTWNGVTKNWTREAPRLSPGARNWAAMAYHAGSGDAVLFGGDPDENRRTMDDTWLWDGAQWRRGVLPAITIGDVSLVEGDEGCCRAARFNVALSQPNPTRVTVDYAAGGQGTVRESTSGTLVFEPGVTSRTVTVRVWGDTTDEPDPKFQVYLTKAIGAIIYDASGLATVLDNDPPATGLRVGVGDVSVHEGDAGTQSAMFVVTLNRASSTTVSVAYATSSGTATSAADFTAKSGTVSFSPGTTTMAVKVPIAAETVLETTETFSFNLSLPTGAKISRPTGVGTIVADD